MTASPTTSNSALPVSAATHIVQDGVSSAIYVLLPILAQAFGISYAQVGVLKGIKGLSQAVLEISSGWFSERLGEVQLIVVGLILSGLGYLLVSAASGVAMIGVCLLVVGAGTGLHHAPCSALIANSLGSTKRSSALGLYNAFGDVGKLAFTGAFSLAIGAGLAWHQVSLLFGMLTILSAIGIGWAARSILGSAHKSTVADHTNDQPTAKGWGILNWRSFGALLIITGLDTMVQTSVLVFIAFVMLSKGLSLTLATAATVLVLAGGVFGKAGCGYLAERLGVRRAFALIQALAAVGLVVVVLAPSGLAMILLVPLGAVVQGTSSITYGFAADLIDPRRMARGYALLYSSGTFASAVGPLLVGLIADGYGLDVAIYVVAVLTVLAIPPVIVLRKSTGGSA